MSQTIIINFILLWVFVLFNLFLILAVVRRVNLGMKNEISAQGTRIVDLTIGQPAPEFLAESLKGEQISLLNYRGHNVAFIFISPQCKACLEEIPSYNDLFQKANKSEILIVLVSFASLDDTRKLAKEYAIESPILATSVDNSFREKYKVMGTPSYCLVNDRGIIMAAGFVNELKAKIDVL